MAGLGNCEDRGNYCERTIQRRIVWENLPHPLTVITRLDEIINISDNSWPIEAVLYEDLSLNSPITDLVIKGARNWYTV